MMSQHGRFRGVDKLLPRRGLDRLRWKEGDDLVGVLMHNMPTSMLVAGSASAGPRPNSITPNRALRRAEFRASRELPPTCAATEGDHVSNKYFFSRHINPLP